MIEILKKIAYREKYSSYTYIKYLRSLGCRIGERCTIFEPRNTVIDTTRPWLIEIGNDVQITRGVIILTHGYDWAVIKGITGEILGSSGGVCIGNNVFIGMNSIILKGVHIGDNVIIGAGSVVTKDIEGNVVAAGNPCKPLLTIDEYYKKRKQLQIEEARELVYKYRERYGINPQKDDLDEFFWLFCDGNSNLTEKWKNKLELVGNGDYSRKVLSNNSKVYEDFESFLNSIEI